MSEEKNEKRYVINENTLREVIKHIVTPIQKEVNLLTLLNSLPIFNEIKESPEISPEV
jgi:hypothetical protein